MAMVLLAKLLQTRFIIINLALIANKFVGCHMEMRNQEDL